MYIDEQLNEINLRKDYPNTSFPTSKDVMKAPDGKTLYRVHPPLTTPTRAQVGTTDGYEIVDGMAHQKLSIRDKTVEELETEFLPHLTNYRYQLETGGVIYNNLTYHTDRESRATWLGLFLQASNDPAFVLPVYKAMDGTARGLTATDIQAIYQAGTQHINKCFVAEDQVAQNIANYTTREEIEQAFRDAYAGL